MENTDDLMLDQKRDATLIAGLLNLTQSPAAVHFSVFDLESRLELLESYWAECRRRDYVLQRYSDKLKERTYFKSETYSTMLSQYLTAKGWFRQRINELSEAGRRNVEDTEERRSQRSEVMSTQAALEKMKLPTFDGSHLNWEHFKDKFTALVVNDSRMDPIIKMQHLSNCLGKEPAEKLKTIKFSGANFQTAWNALCTRYDNKYLRFSVQMETLVKMPSAAVEKVAHLCQLINTVDDKSKLAESTRRDWAKEMTVKKITNGFAKYSDIKEFIEERIRNLDVIEARVNAGTLLGGEDEVKESISNERSEKDMKRHPRFKSEKWTKAHVATQQVNQAQSTITCSFCNENHFLGYCQKFAICSQAQRRAHAVSAKLCFNCLNSHHTVETCNSRGRCMVCGNKHHTKLHVDQKSVSNASATVVEPIEEEIGLHEGSESFNGHVNLPSPAMPSATQGRVLLATACVLLQGSNGQVMTARALLDSGAEESFLSEHVVQTLNLRPADANVMVSGVGGSTTAIAKSRVSVYLKSSRDATFSVKLSALVLKRLTAMLPSTTLTVQPWPHLMNLQLADPHYNISSKIDCILNSEVYAAAITPGIRRGKSGTPVALNSVFGWVLMGTVDAKQSCTHTVAHHITIDHELSTALTRFWEVEEIPSQAILSPEDQQCFNHFKKTHSRDEEGRFIVRLPFKIQPLPLNTRSIAESCLYRLERRFLQNADLQVAYSAFMNEYLNMGHMEEMHYQEVNDSDTFYLPHHAVWKREDKTKIRVVFNASQKNKDGVSLNSMLHTGPKLQEDVIIIVVRWCFFPVVFTCDVKKMFRMYRMHKDDANWQRILWRESPNDVIKVFKLLTLTYGTKPAPFIANACMLQLADDEHQRFPKGAKILRKGRYIDDLFAGEDSVEETLDARNQLTDILSSAGMSVGKWAANRAELLADLQLENQVSQDATFEDLEMVSALGLKWLASEDVFCFQFKQFDLPEKITKRNMLSEIAKLYDPIGWLAPVVISAKILLQNLWLQGLDWDESVSEQLQASWINFRQQLNDVETIKIPRWYGTFKESSWDLHCFCDASERAYAVALYAVVNNETGVTSRLMAAKSKVSPLKVISLPRLELCGALLLSRLVKYLLTNLETKPRKIFCWSDSEIVLAWLHSHPSRWKSFIANRVSEIVTSLPHSSWNHVSSADNPADLATREVTVAQLRDSTIWWKGPHWLQYPSSAWPKTKAHDYQTGLEERSSINAFTATDEDIVNFKEWLLRFSSVDKIIRILSYIFRWKNNAAKKMEDRRYNWLSATELAAGRTYLLRLIQRETFASELKALRSKETVNTTSSLRRLWPFLDMKGLLRVGGRLQNSYLSENEKHPIILPGKHHVVQLIINQAHKTTLHGGPSLVQSHLLRQFWIIRGRNMIRSEIRRCIQCARYRAATIEQQMGPLPEVRTRPARPFSFTGVDFAGPFNIKCSSGRGQKTFKGYVSVFICLVVRAVHIEVVSDLTSAGFLAAFRRFVARRGLCQVIYSDNGRNFQGADTEVHRLFSATTAMSQEIAAVLARDQVEWRYIPPRAPNFGGLWEASIKLFKNHLKRALGDWKLTFEEFSTVCASIEACINSRPLSVLSSSEEDVAALTPGHFLIGASLTALPEPYIQNHEQSSLSSRWALLTSMRNHFWTRWRKEFLLQAQQKSKWLHPNRAFKVGDVVMFKDDLMPPTKWPLARIIKLYQGSDGLSRVACIKTATAEYKRPVNKLILLPTNEEASTHLALLKGLMASDNNMDSG